MPRMPATHQLLELHPFPGLDHGPDRGLGGPEKIRLFASIEQPAGGGLRIGYSLRGAPRALAQIIIPDKGAPRRIDGLWQHTCCEAFIGIAGKTAYREFNFSPSSAWAAYAFKDYRQPAALPLGAVPGISFSPGGRSMTLIATLSPAWLPKGGRLCLGLAAVLRSIDGSCSYWGLAHPAAQPDFHHRDSFTVTL